MGRSIAIFTFFALATLAIILFQPGPRDGLTEEALGPSGTSRNDTSLLAATAHGPLLAAPQVAQARGGEGQIVSGPSVDTVHAALKVSFDNETAAQQAVLSPASFRRPDPVAGRTMPQGTTANGSARHSEVRSMSWQTLNSLKKLGRSDAALGQEGSLVNSIVKRSMAYVESNPVSAQDAAPIAPVSLTVAATASRSFLETAGLNTAGSPAPQSRLQSYTVVSGDNLALIAIKLYGSVLAQDQLLAENPQLLANPDTLRIGQTLLYR